MMKKLTALPKSLAAGLISLVALDLFFRLVRFGVAQRIKNQDPKTALSKLLELDNAIYGLTGQWAVRYGSGRHVKHRLTGYVARFAELAWTYPGPYLDVGCHEGYLAAEISKGTNATVVGVDIDEARIAKARAQYDRPNLEFVHADATTEAIGDGFATIVLSNVLEHIGDRVGFLKKLVEQHQPSQILIRVPNFERDWRVPLKRELGIEWRLDSTHEIEHSVQAFGQEMDAADLEIRNLEVTWGEIWAVVQPRAGALAASEQGA